jgi:type III restriction enzyme
MTSSASLKGYQTAALQSLRAFLDAVSGGGDAIAAFAAITRRTYVEPAQLPGLPYVCLRVPTGGGKTFMAAHTVGIAADAFLRVENPVVLWLVPSQAIRDQTLKTLKDREHPNSGALRDRFGDNFRVMTLAEALYAKRADYDGSACIIVATIQAFRVEDSRVARRRAREGRCSCRRSSGTPCSLRSKRAGGGYAPKEPRRKLPTQAVVNS